MGLISLDISLTSTGMAWTSGSTIYTTKICPNMPNQEMPRYLYTLDRIKAKCEEIDPEMVIIEGYSYGSRGRAITQLSELRGVLKYYFYINNIDWQEVAPKALKKFITGSGNAMKAAMSDAIYWQWGEDFLNWKEDNDKADAFALIKYYQENK